MRNYETVFILNPVLSDDQTKEAVSKFTAHLKSNGAEMFYSFMDTVYKSDIHDDYYHLTQFHQLCTRENQTKK